MHTWETIGHYFIMAELKDVYNSESEWSDPLEIKVQKIKNINDYFFDTPMTKLLQWFPILGKYSPVN
jgi:hypothetical protein